MGVRGPAKSCVLWARGRRNWVLGWYWGFPSLEFHKMNLGGDPKAGEVSRQEVRAGN